MMKKLLALGCAAVLLGGTAAFAASGGDSAVIKGNYTKPSAEELNAAIDAIDEEKLFGDTSAEDYSFGISVRGDLSVEVTSSEGSVNMEGDAEYAFSAAKDGMAGAGKASLSMQANGAQLPSDISMETQLYNDDAYLYMQATLSEGGTEASIGGKLSYEKLYALAEELAGDLSAAVLTESAPPTTLPAPQAPDLAEAIAQLEAAGVEVGLDAADGVKLRFTAGDAYFAALEAEAETAGTPIEFSDKTLEIYLYINEEGLFEQFSAVVDIAFDVKDEENPGSVAMRANFVLKQENVKPQLPSDLGDENKYPSLDGLLA